MLMTIIINLPIMTFPAVKYNKDYDHTFLLLPKYHAWKPAANVTNFTFIIQMKAHSLESKRRWKGLEESIILFLQATIGDCFKNFKFFPS